MVSHLITVSYTTLMCLNFNPLSLYNDSEGGGGGGLGIPNTWTSISFWNELFVLFIRIAWKKDYSV